jgi:hypothetical protein
LLLTNGRGRVLRTPGWVKRKGQPVRMNPLPIRLRRLPPCCLDCRQSCSSCPIVTSRSRRLQRVSVFAHRPRGRDGWADRPAQLGPAPRPLVHGERLAEGEFSRAFPAVAVEESAEKEIVFASELKDPPQPRPPDGVLAKDRSHYCVDAWVCRPDRLAELGRSACVFPGGGVGADRAVFSAPRRRAKSSVGSRARFFATASFSAGGVGSKGELARFGFRFAAPRGSGFGFRSLARSMILTSLGAPPRSATRVPPEE